MASFLQVLRTGERGSNIHRSPDGNAKPLNNGESKRKKEEIIVDPVLARRSIRSFTEEPLSRDTLRLLLSAAMNAPSVDDDRPWHFIVIQDRKTRLRIRDIHPDAYMLSQAPAAILVCGSTSLQKYPGFLDQSCSAASENILIEAQQLGLGGLWLRVYPIEGKVEACRRLLDIPDDIIPFSLIVIGHPAERLEPVDKYNESRVHYDNWENSNEESRGDGFS